MPDPWKDDRLGYRSIGTAYANLIKSIDCEKVISIEAGFGRGKTFFRSAWAKQLRADGQVVVEIDVQQSDHTGEPMITVIGALMSALPQGDPARSKRILAIGKRLGGAAVRMATKATIKVGVDELTEEFSKAVGEDFEDLAREFGEELSKSASKMIASQIAAERVRTTEMPQQLSALRDALVDGDQDKRVIIIVDELDRCHPEYAIAFLEAAKLAFGQAGFIFCLMVNPEYIEALAKHRFGATTSSERYLDKFVDLRLRLAASPEATREGVRELTAALPMGEPFGEDPAFSLETAANLAAELAVVTGLSMRLVERVLLKVEMALRCYPNRPFDLPLLVFLAFRERSDAVKIEHLPRSFLTPDEGEKVMADSASRQSHSPTSDREYFGSLNDRMESEVPELLNLRRERYRLPDDKRRPRWALIFQYLAPHYIPDHLDALNSVADMLPSNDAAGRSPQA